MKSIALLCSIAVILAIITFSGCSQFGQFDERAQDNLLIAHLRSSFMKAESLEVIHEKKIASRQASTIITAQKKEKSEVTEEETITKVIIPEKIIIASTRGITIQNPDGIREIISEQLFFGYQFKNKEFKSAYNKRVRSIRAQGLKYDIASWLPFFVKETDGIYKEVVSSPYYEFGAKAQIYKFNYLEKIKEVDMGAGMVIMVKYVRDSNHNLRRSECPNGALIILSPIQYDEIKKSAEKSKDVKNFLNKQHKNDLNVARNKESENNLEKDKQKIREAIK